MGNLVKSAILNATRSPTKGIEPVSPSEEKVLRGLSEGIAWLVSQVD